MPRFNEKETDEIEQTWRALPADHGWNGWATVDKRPEAIWLYRRRNNWRRFELVKRAEKYTLVDDQGKDVRTSTSLIKVLSEIESVPPLPNA